MLAGNVVFFHAGVAGQLDDVHAVAQGAGDAAQIVGCGDEEHMAQVERNVQEVVVEGAVLLGVQCLQQSCRRSPRKSPASLSISSSSIRGFELLAVIMALMILPGMAPM